MKKLNSIKTKKMLRTPPQIFVVLSQKIDTELSLLYNCL